MSTADVQRAAVSEDDDYEQLIGQARVDLTHVSTRVSAAEQLVENQRAVAAADAARLRQQDFSARARALFAPLSGQSLTMPVVGVFASSLDDNWGAPRDGGVRQHKGIDIFAHKGTPVVAVMDGVVSFIGDQPLGGHCVWLSTEDGMSFYYAHLDRWAAGLYEGMPVERGDILGYVGNTGNAAHTPSHLHFGINRSDEMINPYPLLVRAKPLDHAHLHMASSSSGGASASR